MDCPNCGHVLNQNPSLKIHYFCLACGSEFHKMTIHITIDDDIENPFKWVDAP